MSTLAASGSGRGSKTIGGAALICALAALRVIICLLFRPTLILELPHQVLREVLRQLPRVERRAVALPLDQVLRGAVVPPLHQQRLHLEHVRALQRLLLLTRLLLLAAAAAAVCLCLRRLRCQRSWCCLRLLQHRQHLLLALGLICLLGPAQSRRRLAHLRHRCTRALRRARLGAAFCRGPDRAWRHQGLSGCALVAVLRLERAAAPPPPDLPLLPSAAAPFLAT